MAVLAEARVCALSYVDVPEGTESTVDEAGVRAMIMGQTWTASDHSEPASPPGQCRTRPICHWPLSPECPAG